MSYSPRLPTLYEINTSSFDSKLVCNGLREVRLVRCCSRSEAFLTW